MIYSLRQMIGGFLHGLASLIEPRKEYAYSVEEIERSAQRIGLPVILRPSFALGTESRHLVHSRSELTAAATRALTASPTGEVLVEEAALHLSADDS